MEINKSYDEGYRQGCLDTSWGIRLCLWLAALFVGVTLLSGCEERYRYFCQNPDNFHKEQCQKPRCQFTQTCPEYMVAPILEKQIDQTKPAETPTPVR